MKESGVKTISQLKVLVITPRYDEHSGGDGLYAYRLVSMLRNKNISISILTIKNNYFVLQDGDHYTSEGTASRGREWQELEKVSEGLVAKNYYSRSAKKSIERSLCIVRPSIVHVHSIHQYFTVSTALVLKKNKLPVITTIHDYKILCGNAGFYSDQRRDICYRCIQGNILPALFERCKNKSILQSFGAALQMGTWKILRLNQYSDLFHCPSEFVSHLLKTSNSIKDRITYVRYPSMEEIIPKKINTELPIQLIYYGRMVSHKGAPIFAEAVKDFDFPIHLFGDGPEYTITRSILSHHPKTVFHGWSSRSKIRTFLRPGVIVVLPYLAPETFCFAVLEAMANGACVIATARGAIPELIQHNKNGILIQNPTPQNFRDAIYNLLSDPKKIYRLGREAKTIKKELPTQSVHTDEMIKLYTKLQIQYSV